MHLWKIAQRLFSVVNVIKLKREGLSFWFALLARLRVPLTLVLIALLDK